VKNLSAFSPFGGRWIDRKVKTDEGQIHQNPSSPLCGASPLGEAFQDTDAIDAVRNNRYSVASLLTASHSMTFCVIPNAVFCHSERSEESFQ